MKKFLYIFLVSGFSLIIISCGEVEESTTTDTATTDTTTTSENDSSDDASNLVVTMDNLTIGSQTYSNAFTLVGKECKDIDVTDSSNSDKIYVLETIVYYDNKTLVDSAHLYKDSSCTNKYTDSSVITSIGTLVIPFPFNKIGDNITVVQLSNYLDNGTALTVFDNSSNAVDNGSMYGLIANRDNATSPFKMVGQIYPKSDNEVHTSFRDMLSCRQNSQVGCTSPDNFTNIQSNSVSSSLTLEKYNVMK